MGRQPAFHLYLLLAPSLCVVSNVIDLRRGKKVLHGFLPDACYHTFWEWYALLVTRLEESGPAADPANAHDKHVRLSELLAALTRVRQRLPHREVMVGSGRSAPQVRRSAQKCANPAGSSIGSGCDCDPRATLSSWPLVLTIVSGYRAGHRKGIRNGGAGQTTKSR